LIRLASKQTFGHRERGEISVTTSLICIFAQAKNAAANPFVALENATIDACGAIVGPKQDGKLVVALTAVGDSKVSGIAILDEDNSGVLGLGRDQVQVTVYLVDQASGSSATPAA